jgi:formate/nitrite transporter FocA (FNT family)
LIDVLPGLSRFFCPQCFQHQIFKFTPISFRYGFFVTYLCRYCSCFVDGWGQQLYYPMEAPWKKIGFVLTRLLPVSLGVVVGGLVVSKFLWNLW